MEHSRAFQAVATGAYRPTRTALRAAWFAPLVALTVSAQDKGMMGPKPGDKAFSFKKSTTGSAVKGDAASRAKIIGIARSIDRYMSDKWNGAKLAGAPISEDGEFLRRVRIDLVGQAPTLEELEAFLADTDKEKRAKKIDEYLYGERFPAFWGELYTNWIFGYFDSEWASKGNLQAWLTEQFAKAVPYDAIVRALVTAKGDSNAPGPANFILRWIENNEPDELTKQVSRIFFGIKLNCAHCHNHPFAKWATRTRYYEMTSWFSRTTYDTVGEDNDPNKHYTVKDDYSDAKNLSWTPDGFKDTIRPRFITTGKGPVSDNLREEFALAMTREVQFARAAVNRFWCHMLGKGLVDPVDDFQDRTLPVSVEIMNLLVREFTEARYDVRHILRIIANTKVYQATSVRPQAPEKLQPKQEKTFAFQPLRLMYPGQIFDTIAAATGLAGSSSYRDKPEELQKLRDEFIRLIYEAYTDEFVAPGEFALSTQQIMQLMTWKELYAGLYDSGGTVDRVLAREKDADLRISRLYQALLCRLPTKDELEKSKGKISGEAGRSSYAELGYSILQLNEFYFNH